MNRCACGLYHQDERRVRFILCSHCGQNAVSHGGPPEMDGILICMACAENLSKTIQQARKEMEPAR
jgi:hypothetical protein